ncbi:hypothetical protein PVAG01_10524 [Phlyctema vagabunda]|uniref:TAFII55 protein conserved region domain-containing protein n=1 Tax=Phlyctema vagabunda TaxID=108571 RepID=A0ABR4P2H9_9HELO
MVGIKLKLNLPGNARPSNTNAAPTPTASTSALPLATPISTPGGTKTKIKFKTSQSIPATPALESIPRAEPLPKKTKAGRSSKPSAKIIEANKKRLKEESDSDEEGSSIQVAPPQKKIKLHVATPIAKTPVISGAPKIKARGKAITRKPGEGYDSEASDRESDPTIEEEFVLRMIPGDDCDYLRSMIAEKKLGVPKPNGGADVHFKFFDQELRRAAVIIRGTPYAATMVDLPTVTEGMKSWDRRGWWKTGDICQMLLVFARISNEEEAKTIPLPKTVDPITHQYPHGLTPPMHWARKRRFRKRISKTAIEAVEDAVNKLLAADEEAIDTKIEIIDTDVGSRRAFSPGASSPETYDDGGEEYSGDEDAEGEVDDGGYFSHMNGANLNGSGVAENVDQNNVKEDMDMDEFDLEAELEAAMEEEHNALQSATPMSSIPGATPMNADTPAVEDVNGQDDAGEESFESGSDDDDDDGEDDEIDEDEKARLAKLQTDREDIADMEKQLEEVQKGLSVQANPILKKRLEEQLRKIKAELQLKMSAMPAGEYED